MADKRSNCLTIAVLPLVAALCLAMVFGIYTLYTLPDQAADQFGPPASYLSTWQRIRYAALLMGQAESLMVPWNPGGPGVDFTVAQGESVTSITGRLSESGLIPNPGAFRTYLQYTGIDTTIQAGKYQLSPAMTPIEIARSLQDSSPAEVPFTILAGWRTRGDRSCNAHLRDEHHPRGVPFSSPAPGAKLCIKPRLTSWRFSGGILFSRHLHHPTYALR